MGQSSQKRQSAICSSPWSAAFTKTLIFYDASRQKTLSKQVGSAAHQASFRSLAHSIEFFTYFHLCNWDKNTRDELKRLSMSCMRPPSPTTAKKRQEDTDTTERQHTGNIFYKNKKHQRSQSFMIRLNEDWKWYQFPPHIKIELIICPRQNRRLIDKRL
jgi:hypothetical protein